MDDAGAVVHRDLIPGDHAVLEILGGREVVERPLVRPARKLGPGPAVFEVLVRVALYRDPLAVLAPPVLLLGMHGGRDVRGERPRGGRPDGEMLAGPVAEREPDEE